MFSLLRRALYGSGTVAFLRQQWRDDDARLRGELKEQATGQRRHSKESDSIAKAHAARLVELERSVADLRKKLRLSHHELNKFRLALASDAERLDERYAHALDAARVTAHVARALASAVVERHPMPHIVVQDVLPEDTYRGLLDAIPPTAFFKPDHEGRKLDLKFRATLDVLPGWTRRMWSFFEDVVVPEMLVPGASRALQGASAAPLEATGGRLMLRRPGYTLAPHQDPQRTVATCLLYLAKPGDSESFGTRLLSLNGVPAIDRTSTYYPEAHGYTCELVKTVPFRANTLVVFMNGGAAAHGVEIPMTAPAETERCAYQFYMSRSAEAATGETAPRTARPSTAPAESSDRRPTT